MCSLLFKSQYFPVDHPPAAAGKEKTEEEEANVQVSEEEAYLQSIRRLADGPAQQDTLRSMNIYLSTAFPLSLAVVYQSSRLSLDLWLPAPTCPLSVPGVSFWLCLAVLPAPVSNDDTKTLTP